MLPNPPKRFLLTGANGFIALHILSQLLNAGYHVVATVRTPTKAAALRAQFSTYVDADFLDVTIVPDMIVPDAYDEVFSPSSQPIDVVLHTASPFLYKAATKSNTEEFLDPAIKGTKVLLEAAKKAGTVKRVVMTSSCAAVIDYKREAQKGISRKVYTEADWNDVTYKEGEVGDKSTAYRASKKFSELLAWDYVGGLDETGTGGKGGGGFDLVVLCPPAVQGPVEGTVNKIEDLGESNSRFWALYLQSGRDKEIANKMPLHVFVDVRDLAKAHILAATVPEAGNKRFLICAGSFSNKDVTEAMRSQIPELEMRTPIKSGNGLSESDYGYSSERAKEILGLTYRPGEETWVQLGKQLLEIEKREAEGK